MLSFSLLFQAMYIRCVKYCQSWLARSRRCPPVDSPETHISLQAGEEMLVRYPRIREPTNLLTSILGLRFHVASLHMRVILLNLLYISSPKD